MKKQTERQEGYDEACNDMATALVELSLLQTEPQQYVSVKKLVDRFQQLKEERFHKDNLASLTTPTTTFSPSK